MTDKKHLLIPLVGFIIALLMNFWHLGQPAKLMSDEHYFVQDARKYATHTSYVDAHPPLGKMQMAAAIAIFGDTPWVWRMINAIEGALLVPLLWWLGWLLTKDQRVAGVAMVLGLLDGLRVVESRSGLINIPYTFYALAALACVLKASQGARSAQWLAVAGLLVGAAMSVKWLALFVVVPVIVWWFWHIVRRPVWPRIALSVMTLIIVPIFVYWVIFAAHFTWLQTPSQIVDTNVHILAHHTQGKTGHLYQIEWWGWPLLQQPFPYWTEVVGAKITHIWTLPNPWIWWSGWALLMYGFWKRWRDQSTRLPMILLFCSWVPFAFIERDMFLYHALPFSVLLCLYIAMFTRSWWRQPKVIFTYLAMAALFFIWFTPWYFNIPMNAEQHQLRQWLPSWSIKNS